MARQQPVEFDIEGEGVRGDLRPAADGVLLRQGIERRVDLDELEALRIPGQAVPRGEVRRVPLLDEAGIGPAGGSSPDGPWHAWDDRPVLALLCTCAALAAVAPPDGHVIHPGHGHPTAGRDIVRGTTRRDVLKGRAANAPPRGGREADRLYGGTGNDRLPGGAGGDHLSGGPGVDALSGQSADDTLRGGAGADRLLGGRGDDWLLGGPGDDVLD